MTTGTGLIVGEDGRTRCWWPGDKQDYLYYHDNEWGTPVADDVCLFEKICLEGFQSGLSWLTILRKRENFRAAFDGFNFEKIADFGAEEIERLVNDAGIVRHRGKIQSTINNARRALELRAEFGSLATYFWRQEPGSDERPKRVTYDWSMANPTSATSARVSKDLKKRGWSFVGPTTIYAFMQAMGLVNDHLDGCYCRDIVEEARSAHERPV
ncbi:MAG: DNA-3-methyladenine glycosylase I [Pseudomonadota bacterium]